MEQRWTEHHVQVSDNTALVVYCAACARVLAEYANNNVISHLLARMVSHDHRESYSRNHTVVVTDIRDRRMEMEGENGFTDMTPHD